MKKILYILMSMLLVTGMVACNSDSEIEEVDLGYLKLVSSNVNFDYTAASGQIVVDTNDDVTAVMGELADGEVWATATASGNVVTVTATANTSTQARHTYVTISAGNRKVMVPVTQNVSGFNLSTKSLSFSKEKGSETVTITPALSGTVEATVVEADRSWLSAQVDGQTLTVAVVGNDGNERTSLISVRFGVSEFKISVTQATSLTVSETALSFGPEEESKKVSIDVTSGITLDISSTASWAKPTFDGQTKELTVAVDVNPGFTERTATITIETPGGVKAQIAVTQRPWTISALIWETWATGTYTGALRPTAPKNTTLEKAKYVNAFRIVAPYSNGANYVFTWDIDNKATSIDPIPLFIDSTTWASYGLSFPVQYTGMGNDAYHAMWVTDPDPEYTYYLPEYNAFVINNYYGAYGKEDLVFAGRFADWSDDTFVISEFLQGNPWE